MTDDFEEKSTAFLDWFLSFPSASLSPKIRLADLRDRGAGRAVVARDDISTNTELFSIPRSCIISTANSALLQQLPSIASSQIKEDPWLSLILVLMYEYFQGKRFKPYLDILPSHFDTLMFWSDAELTELQASAVREKIGRQNADEMFEGMIVPLIKQHTEVFYPTSSRKLPDSELVALAHRMGSIIMAYAFDLEQEKNEKDVDEDGFATDEEELNMEKAMVPMADMLNSTADFNARLFEDNGNFCMRAVRPIKSGEEVLNDYGPLPRSEQLRRYGYISLKNARYDVVELCRDLLIREIQAHRPLDETDVCQRLSYLENTDALDDSYHIEWNLDEDLAKSIDPRRTVDFSRDLTIFTRTLLTSCDRYKKLEALSKSDDVQSWMRMGKVMQKALTTRLQQYGTSIIEDEEVLKRADLRGRRRMAVEVRLSEKRLLAAAQVAAQSMVELNNVSGSDEIGSAQPPPKKQRKTRG